MSSADGTPPEGGYGAPWTGFGDSDGLSDEGGIPSRVVAFDEEEERSGTSWLPRGKPILLVAAAAGAFLVIGSTSPGHGTGDVDSGGAAVDPAPSSDPAAAVPSSSARSDGEPVFVQRAEAVATAVARYRDRRRMYERGRLGCGSLESAHDSVDRSFLEMALTVRDRRGSLDSSSRARFDDLADRADEVDRHFDGSACRSSG